MFGSSQSPYCPRALGLGLLAVLAGCQDRVPTPLALDADAGVRTLLSTGREIDVRDTHLSVQIDFRSETTLTTTESFPPRP